jgi:hypothetical protein
MQSVTVKYAIVIKSVTPFEKGLYSLYTLSFIPKKYLFTSHRIEPEENLTTHLLPNSSEVGIWKLKITEKHNINTHSIKININITYISESSFFR